MLPASFLFFNRAVSYGPPKSSVLSGVNKVAIWAHTSHHVLRLFSLAFALVLMVFVWSLSPNALSCPQWTTVNSPVSEPPLSSWKGHAVWGFDTSSRDRFGVNHTQPVFVMVTCPSSCHWDWGGDLLEASKDVLSCTLRRENRKVTYPSETWTRKPGVQMLVVTILQPDDEAGTGPCCHGRGPGFTNAGAGG